VGSKKVLHKILVIHGPNLNMLGQRETAIYGKTSLADINAELKQRGQQKGLVVTAVQSNHEGAIVDTIQHAAGEISGLIINPAAYTHSSIAIRDALLVLEVPMIEVHLSNIHRRESFRHRSLMADVVTGQIIGMGVQGYYLALQAICDLIATSDSV
jgi:3-dehydroquinate dehydratase II